MTIEKAIEKLNYARQNADEELDSDWCASLDMAIKALETKDVLENIRAEIIQIPTISFNANDIYKCDVLKIIDKYRAESEEV